MVSLEEALRIVEEHARNLAAPMEIETVELGQGLLGRVLAGPIVAGRDQPPFDRATRDGFAVRAEDLAHGGALRVVGLVRAGERWDGGALDANEAIEIMTGAPLPAGADCVLMVEHVYRDGDVIMPRRSLLAGDNVVPRGAEARAGDGLLQPRESLDAAGIAVAAGCGRNELVVFAKPRVGILATGDELVEPGAGTLEDWQIYNSNTYAVAALVAAQGGLPERMPIARDTRAELAQGIAQGSQCDLLLLSGGVSMGKYDFVEQALADRGAEFFFTGVKMQPGKPVVFGRLPGVVGQREWTYFFGLPGNPVSTEVCFHLFAATMLRALAGRGDVAPQFVAAVAAEAFAGKPGITRLLPARLESSLREVTVRPVVWQGSGDTAANARANCYCVVEEAGVAGGQVSRVLLR